MIKSAKTNLDEPITITKTSMTKYKYHHPKTCIEKNYLPREKGDNRWLALKRYHLKQIWVLSKYLNSNPYIPLHIAVSVEDKNYTPLTLHTKPKIKINSQDAEVIQRRNAKHINLIQHETIKQRSIQNWLRIGLVYWDTESSV